MYRRKTVYKKLKEFKMIDKNKYEFILITIFNTKNYYFMTMQINLNHKPVNENTFGEYFIKCFNIFTDKFKEITLIENKPIDNKYIYYKIYLLENELAKHLLELEILGRLRKSIEILSKTGDSYIDIDFIKDKIKKIMNAETKD